MNKKLMSTLRSPEMLAPAWMPVTEGKKIANTLKKSWFRPSLYRKLGPKLSLNVFAVNKLMDLAFLQNISFSLTKLQFRLSQRHFFGTLQKFCDISSLYFVHYYHQRRIYLSMQLV